MKRANNCQRACWVRSDDDARSTVSSFEAFRRAWLAYRSAVRAGEATPDLANTVLHPKRHSCPVCRSTFRMPLLIQNTPYRYQCGTRITVAPGRHHQRFVDWTEV